MASQPPQRPTVTQSSGMWPSASANSFRQQYLTPAANADHYSDQEPAGQADPAALTSTRNAQTSVVTAISPETARDVNSNGSSPTKPSLIAADSSGASTKVLGVSDSSDGIGAGQKEIGVKRDEMGERESPVEQNDFEKETKDEIGGFEPIKTTSGAVRRPPFAHSASGISTEDELFRVLSRKRSTASGGGGPSNPEEMAEIERLMSRMFGRNRQEQSEEEKTRHVGLVFKNVTVTGLGLGSVLQPTVADLFLGLPRLLKGLFSGKAKGITKKPPIRTIINGFTGCVRPGEMLLVLGRPGAGCSTFLKVLANQRFGYNSIDGEVTYGGTDAKTMGKDYRGEIVYNPEDDLHYATLSVKQTLSFALKTRTPGKASRNQGESRADYVREFLRVVARLFWIEHTSELDD